MFALRKQFGDVVIHVRPPLRTEWWPMIAFIVFKSPPEGKMHIFRPGEPMLQILILPVTAEFTLAPMDEEEAAEREMRGRRIHASRGNARRRFNMAFEHRHGLRRHLPPSSSRRQG